MRDKTARDRSHAVQAGDAVDQLRDARPEIALDLGQSQFLQRRYGKEQRRQPRIGVELEPGDDQRHAQRMTPDPFATAQRGRHRSRGQSQPPGGCVQLGRRQAFAEGKQRMFEVALRGDRVGD
jgi:hypothetical protein